MAVTKRIISCLDIKDGKVVKGTAFLQLRDMGDPVELAYRYSKEGIDELVLLDISATLEKRKTFLPVVTAAAKEINIPFTVGGGINSIDDAYHLLSAGADKVSVNSAAVKDRNLLTELARRFGTQCVVLAIDAKKVADKTHVFINAGKQDTHMDVLDWVHEGVARGAGEILLTSIDMDGARTGYDTALVKAVAARVNVSIIASGGAGKPEHFKDILADGYADGALAAGVFHEAVIDVKSLKQYLRTNNILVRL